MAESLREQPLRKEVDFMLKHPPIKGIKDKMEVDLKQLSKSILSLIIGRLKGIENPYKGKMTLASKGTIKCYSYDKEPNKTIFNEAIQAVIKELEE